MVYLVVAFGQFGVILLTAIAKAAGLIVGTTALLICVSTALAVALHAAYIHLERQRPGPQAAEQLLQEPGDSATVP